MMMHMDLGPYIDSIRRDLAAAAEVGGPEAVAAAERLTAALDSAVRLSIMDALSAATEVITRDLAPGAVELRIRGREPDFVVTRPPAPAPPEAPPPPPPPPMPEGDEGGTARLTLRLPESLKPRIEEAAAKEGVSVNAWLVRAVMQALSLPADDSRGRGRSRRGSFGIGQHVTGWVR